MTFLRKQVTLFYVSGLTLIIIIPTILLENNYTQTTMYQRKNKITRKRCFTTSLTRTNIFNLTTKKYCNRFIRLQSEQGGLGNVMFEIASLIGMAYDLDSVPIINESCELLKYFNLPNSVNITITNSTTCNFKHAKYKTCLNAQDKNITLGGYILSWKHFRNASSMIKRIFEFKAVFIERAGFFLHNVSPHKGYQNVFIHVRRGDFLMKYNRLIGRNVAGVEYIYTAMNHFRQKYKKVRFVVVSDDMKWCKANIKDVVFSPFKEAADDMALMSLCNHAIVTVGTFGWWGAWLSGGETIYFKHHVRIGSKLWKKTRDSDVFPSHWIGL